jgi:hypothetical protein
MSSKHESLQEESCGNTSEVLAPVLILRLACGCTLTELVGRQRTQTLLQLWRVSTCERLSHFTVEESGWPQLADAVKATILHSDVSLEKYGEHGAI